MRPPLPKFSDAVGLHHVCFEVHSCEVVDERAQLL
jgi:hypothetical protein